MNIYNMPARKVNSTTNLSLATLPKKPTTITHTTKQTQTVQYNANTKVIKEIVVKETIKVQKKK